MKEMAFRQFDATAAMPLKTMFIQDVFDETLAKDLDVMHPAGYVHLRIHWHL